MGLFSKRSNPLPETSYGYIPPSDATAHGWKCPSRECSTSNVPAPRSWPFACPMCGTSTDPEFYEPWARKPMGRWLLIEVDRAKREATSGGWSALPMYQSELEAWTFQDALLRGAPAEASEAQVRLHELIARTRDGEDPSFQGGSARMAIVLCAINEKAPDSAALELQDWLGFVPIDGVKDGSAQQANIRQALTCVTMFGRQYPRHPATRDLVAQARPVFDQVTPILSEALVRDFLTLAR